MTEFVAGKRNQMMSDKDWDKLASKVAPKSKKIKKEASSKRNGMTFETMEEIRQIATKKAANEAGNEAANEVTPSAPPANEATPYAPPTMTSDQESNNLSKVLREHFPNTGSLLLQYKNNATVVNAIIIVLREVAKNTNNMGALAQAVKAHTSRKNTPGI